HVEGDETFVAMLGNLQASDRDVRIEVDSAIGMIIDDEFFVGLDRGDAPEGYPVRAVDNGARHRGVGVHLGPSRDTEPGGQTSDLADADDVSGTSADDEDGVHSTLPILADPNGGTTSSLLIEVSDVGFLDAWIDFAGDGTWDDEDQIADRIAVVAGENLISFDVPSTAIDGNAVARFRVSRNGGHEPTGYADSGEVEDHRLAIQMLEPTSVVDPTVDLDATGPVVFTVAQDVLSLASPDGVVTAALAANFGVFEFVASSTLEDTPAVAIAGPDWRYEQSEVQNGRLVRHFVSGGGDTSIQVKLIGPHDWNNPIESLDVNADGNVSSLDALETINAIIAGRIHTDGQLVDATGLTEFPNRFYDVSSDGRLTAFDALQIINELIRTSTASELEQVLVPLATSDGLPLPPVSNTEFVDAIMSDWRRRQESAETTLF
ncbi:MAG: GEVED domain-containing protein, partial [Planctomycetota bacterium]